MSSEPFSVDLRKAGPLGRYFLGGSSRDPPLTGWRWENPQVQNLRREVYDEVWFVLQPTVSCLRRNLASRVEGEARDVP